MDKPSVIRTDVVVVGAAYAGLPAAIEARAAGADVVVLTRQGKFANSSSLGGGAFALVDTPMQRERKIEDSSDLLRRDILRSSRDTVDAELAEALGREGARMYDFLTSFGAKFYEVTLFPGHIVPRVHLEIGLSGARTVGLLYQAAESKGARIMAGAVAQDLLMDGGRVKGVTAIDPEGNRLEIEATRGVVLGAGGFSRNKDMMRRYAPHLADLVKLSGAGSTGDGIRMGIAAGGDILHMDAALMMSLVSAHKRLHVSGEVLAKGGILVNKDGDRFVDEGIGYARSALPLMRQRDSVALLVVDETLKMKIRKMDKYIALGVFFGADSLEDLAAKSGITPARLRKTIEEHNARPAGRPTLTGRLYGAWIRAGVVGTQGGLRINSRAQVLDREGKPIPGLYAAGDSTAGPGGASTPDCPCPGYMVGTWYLWALSFGRIAGRSVTA